MLSVVLAEDRVLVRAGLRTLIEAEPDLTVAEQVAECGEAVAAARRHRPDVVLLNLAPPDPSGIDATKTLMNEPVLDGVHVLLLTVPPIDGWALQALRHGASGVLLNDAEPAELLRGIRAAGVGYAALSPVVARYVVDELAAHTRAPTSDHRLSRLSARETEVVGLVAEGLTNEAIAVRLGISPTTARTHISRAMVKVDVHCRAQLVVFAYETGLVWAGKSAPTPPSGCGRREQAI